MKEIRNLCRKLEQKEDIRILFAVESGSRAWNMASKDSDYDIRFVYARKIEEYLKIQKPDEVIDLEKGNLDLVGFDLFKYSSLLAKSNPTVIEWLFSPVIYYGSQNKAMRKWAENNFNPLSLYKRYESMSRNNYEQIKKGDVSIKRYLYVLRGLFNAQYVRNLGKIPPMDFTLAIKEMQEYMPAELIEKTRKLIDEKKNAFEKQETTRINELDSYIEEFLMKKEAPEPRKSSVKGLNMEIRKILLE